MNAKTNDARTALPTTEPDTQRRCKLALCGAPARRIVVAQAVAAALVLAPLALLTRNTWQAAALLAMLVGSLLRWITSRQLGKQLRDPASGARAWPMTLAAHAVTSTAFALACVAGLMRPELQPGVNHTTAIMVLATAVMAGSGLWALAPNRHASWSFVAPLALVPAAVAFVPGAFALGAAGALAATVAAAIALATVAERIHAAHIEAELRARWSAGRLDRLAREHEASNRVVDALEAQRHMMFESANVGLALVVDRRIKRINAHLAQRLGQKAETLEGQDVLQLLERESRDVVDAVARARDPQRNSAQARLNLGVRGQGPRVVVTTPIADAGALLWVFKDSEDTGAGAKGSARSMSASTSRVGNTATADDAVANGGFAPTQMIDRAGFAPTQMVDRAGFAPTELVTGVDASHADEEAPARRRIPLLPAIE